MKSFVFRSFVLTCNAEKNPPIDQVIQAGAIAPLVVVLNKDPEQNNQFEAAWALTNVASGTTEQTQILLRNVRASFAVFSIFLLISCVGWC